MDLRNYNDFAEKCVDELKTMQTQLFDKYDLNNYENWFYDQVTGLLTFSTGDNEVNFKYFQVGSYSTKSNTWKWAWDNEHTLENVKNESLLIKEFGQQSGFEKLTQGYFPSNEIEAWEFAAIGNKLSNAVGVYRPENNGLQIFMVVKEFIDNERAQEIKDKYIACNEHGTGRLAFVCSHLNTKNKTGFEEAFETFEHMQLEEDDDFQAWCNECEVVRQHEDGWNETSMAFASIKLVCEKCYFDIKELNTGQR
jgi:hypothetical protein